MNNMVNTIQSVSRAVAQQVVAQDRQLFAGNVDTTDATPTNIFLIEVEDQTAGIIQVMCVGFDGTDAATGIKQARYKKVGGSLTIGTVDSLLPIEAEGTLAAATFTIAGSSDNIAVQVTGIAATAISWKAEYKLINVLKEAVLP